MDNSILSPIAHKAKQQLLSTKPDFVGCVNGGTHAIALTPEAEEQLFQIQVDAGCRKPRPQLREQSAAESLDSEIVADWNTGRLTTEQIRSKKRANPQYGARLDAMLEDG